MLLTWDEVQRQFEDSVKTAVRTGQLSDEVEAFFQLKMVSVYDSWENGHFTSSASVNNHVNNLILKG
jgi:hypothetical protein